VRVRAAARYTLAWASSPSRALEVGSADLVIVLAVAQHVVGGGEHGGGHGDDGLHRPAALLEAQELGAQVPVPTQKPIRDHAARRS
jgi:hypothetical protein